MLPVCVTSSFVSPSGSISSSNGAPRNWFAAIAANTTRQPHTAAAQGRGLDALRSAVARALTGEEHLRDTPAVANARHVALLHDARAALARAFESASAGAPEEFVAADLQQARAAFDEIVGIRTSDDVLRHIFERFCIGK